MGAATDAGSSACTPGKTITPKIRAELNSGDKVCFTSAGTLPVVLGQGRNGKIDGNNVNGCVRADFGSPLPFDFIELTVARENETSCGASCADDPCQQGLSIWRYDPVTSTYADMKLLTDVTQTNVAVVMSAPVHILVICRDNNSSGAMRVEEIVGHCEK